jgi:DNA-binding response OmpR family regulator
MTTQSAASTLGKSWDWRVSQSITQDHGGWGRAALAADDVPRAKVLVVGDEAVVALDLQRTLREAGYRVIGPATTLSDVQKFINRGTIDGAVLDLALDRRTPIPVADLLAFAEVPFIFLTDGDKSELPRQHAHRPAVRRPYTRHELLAALERAMRRPARRANDMPLRPPPVTFPRVFPQL